MSAKVASALGALLVVLLLLAASIIGLVRIDFTPDDSAADRGQNARGDDSGEGAYLSEGERAPREFLYLDSARAEAYLSQLRGGNETLRKISTRTSRKAGAEIGFGGVKASGEVAREGTVEHTVNATTASNFLELTEALRGLDAIDELPPPRATAPDDSTLRRPRATMPDSGSLAPPVAGRNADFRRAWAHVREGDIVRFIATIRRPTFVRVYQTLRQVPADSKLGRQGAGVRRRIGEARRLPLVVEAATRARSRSSPARVLRLVMPTQAANLTLEPSLFAPRLTVVGKVVRRVDVPADRYRDLAFYNRFAPVLTLPARARKRLNAPLERLRGELLRYRDIVPPAAVVLPIAIYK
jgi:hypothetical protein